MHEATPYGHLLVNGQSPTDAQLAVLVGATPDQITAALGELESAGVFSRTRKGVVYSRKLTRMAKKAAVSRNNGRKGGNPKLCNNKKKPGWDNPDDKPPDKPQKPDTRNQIGSSGSKLPSPPNGAGDNPDNLFARLGEASGDTIAAMDFQIILNLIKPTSGEPCDLEQDVLPTITALCQQRLKEKPNDPIRSWSYFERPILSARDRRLNGNPDVARLADHRPSWRPESTAETLERIRREDRGEDLFESTGGQDRRFADGDTIDGQVVSYGS